MKMSELTQNNIGAEARAINAEFDKTGVTFHNRAEALAAFKEGGRAIVEEDGQLFTHYDGEAKVPLANALLRFAYDNRTVCDGRTLPRQGVGTSRPGLASKADYPDTASKLKAIAENGAEWWEKLPLTGVATSEILTRQDWYRASRAERVRLTALDPDYFAKLKPSPFQTMPGSAKINTEALDKIASIRPASRRPGVATAR
jgi:hypothetical protein